MSYKKYNIYNLYNSNFAKKNDADIYVNDSYFLKNEPGIIYNTCGIIKDTYSYKVVYLFNGCICGPRFDTIKAAKSYIDNAIEKIQKSKTYKTDKKLHDAIYMISLLYAENAVYYERTKQIEAYNNIMSVYK